VIDVIGIRSRVSRRPGRDAGRRKGAADGVFPSSAPSSSSSAAAGHVAIAAAAPVALLAGACAAGVAAASRHAAFSLDAWHPTCSLAVVCIGRDRFHCSIVCMSEQEEEEEEERSLAPEPDVEGRGGSRGCPHVALLSPVGVEKEAGRDEKGGE